MKYPKRLILNPITVPGPNVGNFDKCFYRITLDPQNKKLPFYSFLVLASIALLCLFPVWPMIVKKGIFYVSLYLLVFTTAFFNIRLFIYLFIRSLGYSFWILPNINSDELPIKEIFRPLLSCEKQNDSWKFVIFRFFLLLSLVMTSILLWQEREMLISGSK